MKNRIWVFVVVFVTVTLFSMEKLSAQNKTFSTQMYRNNIELKSYNGVIVRDAFTYQVKLNNTVNTNWYIALKGNFSEFVQGSIRITLNRVVVDGGSPIRNIALTNYAVNSVFESIITSNQSLENNATYKFIFDVEIMSGDYLNALTPKVYFVGLDFSINGVELNGSMLDIAIYNPLTDMPPSGFDFGFQVHADATLDFATPEQYTRQVENDLNNSWVNVTSKNSGYLITVKTNNPNFELIRNDSGVSGDATIPVNVVNVEMQSVGSGTSQGAKTLSSTTAQTLFIGTENNNSQKLPVRYFITKTETEKLATKPSGEYKAILTYTLEPN